MGCMFQEGMTGMEFRAESSVTQGTPVDMMRAESAATVPPLSDTTCRKEDPICTAPHCDNKFDEKRHTVAMCMIVKEEEPYIDEFVDYHHALGFDAFYIYDNSDNYVLRQWGYEKGCHVTVVPFPGVAQQWTAFHTCSTMALHNNHTWVAFFDTDEILVLKKHRNVHSFLEEHCSSGALGINWLVFGTAERLAYSPQPFTKRFRFRKRKPEPMIKTIARLSDIDLSQGTLKIHYPFLKPGFSQHDTNGRNFSGPSNPFTPIDQAVLHHYKYKSYQEYVEKSVRGRATYDREAGKVEQQVEQARRGMVPAARWFDDTAWMKMKEYVPRYVAYDVIFPDHPA
eukprot:scaffold42455_cov183-Amphora_coffeaeformis.AAC.1